MSRKFDQFHYSLSQCPSSFDFDKKGFSVKGAEKGKGSIEDGIEYIRSFDKVIIHPRCKNVIYELLGSKTINSLDSGEIEFVNVTYIPDKVENIAIKVVVDNDDDVFEDFTIFENAENNNILTSIAGVRDLDVVLESFEILYDEAVDGIIPISVFARNKIVGGGGIDSYDNC